MDRKIKRIVWFFVCFMFIDLADGLSGWEDINGSFGYSLCTGGKMGW